MANYTNQSQQHILFILETLAQQPFTPISVRDIGQLSDRVLSRDQVFRTLENLVTAGWALKVQEGYKISPRITQLSESVRLAIAELHYGYLALSGKGVTKHEH